jgi:DNA replication protein DnaC
MQQNTADKVRKLPATEELKRRIIAEGGADYGLRIPRRFDGKGLHNFEGNTAQADAARAAIESGKSVYIHGPCGTGKTHFAVGLLREWWSWAIPSERLQSGWMPFDSKPGVSCEFVSMIEFVFRCRDTIGKKTLPPEGMGRPDRSEYDVIKRLHRHNVVVLDDLLASRMTEYAITITALLFDEIYQRCKPAMIMTCNFSLDQVAKIIDDRTASRIAEMCGEAVIKIDGPDRRLA